MDNCLGVIGRADIERNFGTLCKNRPVYMLPYGGRYRLIDFALSNMVNSGIKNVALYPGERMKSTIEHVGDGKHWDLNRKINGLSIFPIQLEDGMGITGDIYQYYLTMDFFENAKEENIYMITPNVIASLDIQDMFNYFKETDADITLAYKVQENNSENYINSDELKIDRNRNFVNFDLNLGSSTHFNAFMGSGFIKKNVFLKIIKEAIDAGDDLYLKDAVSANKKHYKINSYEFKGHMENIRNTKTYYDANMNLLDSKIYNELFYERGSIFTKQKDEPSTLYSKSSKVENSLIANGCIIKGHVENSIIFRGVKIGQNSIVKNSILMEKSEIGDNAIVVNTILDKVAVVNKSVNLRGSISCPYVAEKRAIIKRKVRI